MRRATKACGESGVYRAFEGQILFELGRFEEARASYEEGIGENPEYARLYRNLGILCDIYLQEPECALRNFESYQQLSEGNDEQVKRWIADVERRVE